MVTEADLEDDNQRSEIVEALEIVVMSKGDDLMVELHTRYQAGIPIAYIYGEKSHALLVLNNGGGYPSADEALRAYTRKKMELARQAEERKATHEALAGIRYPECGNQTVNQLKLENNMK